MPPEPGVRASALSPATTRTGARIALAAHFREAGIDSAEFDARLLVCAACGIDHSGLIRDPDVVLGEAAATLAAMAGRRVAREPVSRILGRREFWGLSLAIDSAVLDPRPETEGLVASVVDAIGGRRSAKLRLLDLGTGSGAILCALLSELPRADGIGVDLSAAACRVARSNLERLGFGGRSSILCGRWAQALSARFDIVVSNPPYVASAVLTGLDREVRDHDPLSALDGGSDGLDPYRTIVPDLDRLLAPDGVAAFECGHDQGERVATMMRRQGCTGVMVYRDLAGLDRIVVGGRPT